MKMKCVLIDNKPQDLKSLAEYLLYFPDFEIIKTFENEIEGLKFINKNEIDVVFMDIKAPFITDYQLINSIKKETKVVIVTAFREFAADSYDLGVLDYLIKPVALIRFIKCVNRINAEIGQKNSKINFLKSEDSIFIKENKKMIKINLDEIVFIESMKEYIKVVTLDKSYITYKSLTAFTDELPLGKFIRIHKSYTISIPKVKFIEGNRIQIGEKLLPIGRVFRKDVKAKILP